MSRRTSERFTIERDVAGLVDGQSVKLFLYNLSASGCMVEMRDNLLWQGDLIRLDIFDYAAIDGDVVWTAAGCAGVRFSQSLPDGLAARLGLSSIEDDFSRITPRDRFGAPLDAYIRS